ncbi:MAG: hypothetical protein L0H31_04695 [Nocardioidaceae bacterium]|nr:hypothetical protein [Nocardioidaceae bacterium]
MKAISTHADADSPWVPPAAMAASGVLAVAASDLAPYGEIVQAGGGALVVGGAAAAVAAWRQTQRQQLLDAAANGMAHLIGRDVDQVEVAARRWRGPGFVGTPTRVSIRYDPGVVATSDWMAKVREQLEQRFDVEFQLDKHDRRRRRLKYRINLEAAVTAPVPALATRATDMVEHLLGKGARSSFTWDGNALIAVDVVHQVGVRVAQSGAIRNNIERTWQEMLPGRWRTKWDLEQDTVRFEIRPKIPAVLERNFAPVPPSEADRVPYAVDEDGATLYWNLSSSAAQPHCLITGGTGAGKTNTMRGIIIELSRRGAPLPAAADDEVVAETDGQRPPPRLLLCDPKRIEFVGFRSWPNVEIVATSVPDIVATIRYVFLEMERRYALIESGECSAEDFSRLVLVVDEFRYFYGVCNTWYASVKASGGTKECPIFSDFFAIASLGRSAGVHLLLGTQRPDAYWLGGDVRDQFAARYSLGRLSPEGARMMWGAHHIGVSVPRGVPGRGTSVLPDGTPVECQSFWTPDPRSNKPADQELLDQLRPQSSHWQEHVIVPPPESDDDGNPLDPKGRYLEFANAEYALAEDHPDVMASQRSAKAMLTAPGPAPTAEPQDDNQPSTSSDTYTEPVIMRAADIEDHEGWLLLVDEPSGTWGVIESVEDDVLTEDDVLISWRSDQDDSDDGLMAIERSGHLTLRAPQQGSE